MEVKSTAKNIRISPQKVRVVADQIRRVSPKQSLMLLKLTNKLSSKPLGKVISSAIANAKNNFNLNEETLTFKSITVEKGPMFKRFRPVSRGRAHSILKRTSHIKVVLEGQAAKDNKTLKTKPVSGQTVEKNKNQNEK